MMEGLHNEWNRIPMSNAVIRYNNIPSGDYKLRIRIQSKDNINGERVLNIVKDEFWYKTSLAISLYIISLILFIAYIIFRIKSKERTKFFNRVQELVEKKNIELPDRLVGIKICTNPRCITSTEQGIQHIFQLTDRAHRIYRCIYCEADK